MSHIGQGICLPGESQDLMFLQENTSHSSIVLIVLGLVTTFSWMNMIEQFFVLSTIYSN